jgi:hypothetical protein
MFNRDYTNSKNQNLERFVEGDATRGTTTLVYLQLHISLYTDTVHVLSRVAGIHPLVWPPTRDVGRCPQVDVFLQNDGFCNLFLGFLLFLFLALSAMGTVWFFLGNGSTQQGVEEAPQVQ